MVNIKDGDVRTRDEGKYEFMSKSHTDAIRIVLILIIILYHESLYLDVEIMPREGAYSVMVFFFLSGYGLYLSSSKPNYLRDFVQKKIVVLLVRYWMIILCTIILTAVLYCTMDGVVKDLINLTQSHPSWYVLQLLFFYLIFYISLVIFKNKRNSILLMCVLIPFLMYAQFRYFNSNLYLRSGLGFIFGAIFARYKHYFDRIPLVVRMVVVIVAGCVLFFNDDYSYTTNVYMTPLFFLLMILAISSIDIGRFSVLLVVLGAIFYLTGSITCGVAIMLSGLCEFTYTSRFLRPLGKYSLEMFLTHWMLMIYFYEEIGITDTLWLSVATIAATIAFAVVVKKICDIPINRYTAAVTDVGNRGL